MEDLRPAPRDDGGLALKHNLALLNLGISYYLA